jgi:integrase
MAFRPTPPFGSAKPVPKIDLSDAGLRSFAVPQRGTVDYWDTKLPGFGCRVSQGGAKTFILKLHNSRKAIGRYPLISLSEARTEAKRLLAEKTLGKLRPHSITFPVAVEEFLEEKATRRRPITVADHKRHLGLLGFKGPLADIGPDDLTRKMKSLARSEFNHRLSCAKTFFTWAQKKRYIVDNPTAGFTPHSIVSRSRVLTDDELRAVWNAAEEAEGHFGVIVRLLILTGMRRGECAALQTSWIHDSTIVLPKEATKNGREHVFPIEALATSILASALPSDASTRLFPARGKSETPFNGWSKGKVALDKLASIAPWTLHDLRRTFATNLAKMGVAPHIVERLINHVTGTISGVAAIYNRHAYMDEMRAAIVAWEKRLTTILADKSSDDPAAPPPR